MTMIKNTTRLKKQILNLVAGVAILTGALLTVPAMALESQTLSAPCTALPAIVTSSMYIRGSSGGAELRSGDPVGPFPLSTILPFPWKTINGIWSVPGLNGRTEYFSFQVQDSCDGRQVLKVQRFDGNSYAVTEEGFGIGLANDTMIRAVMTSRNTQYMMFVRQFRDSGAAAKGKITTVITTRPFDGNEGGDVHSQATQETPLTLEKVLQKAKKQRDAEIRRSSAPARR